MNAPKPPSLTSLTLLGRVQDARDATAWGDFVDRYAPQIFEWCRRFSLQESDASDVTQEVLCKLVAQMQTFRYEPEKGRFRGWLKTVTTNVVRDMARSRVRSASQAESEFLELLEDERATTALYESIERAWQLEVLAVAEANVQMRVQPHTWEAYRLTTVEALPAPDVAARMNLPVADVYVAKSRVIKMLRAEVQRLADS